MRRAREGEHAGLRLVFELCSTKEQKLLATLQAAVLDDGAERGEVEGAVGEQPGVRLVLRRQRARRREGKHEHHEQEAAASRQGEQIQVDLRRLCRSILQS